MNKIDELIKSIVIPLVNYPDEVTIQHTESSQYAEYHLQLNADDVGRIIGKHGHVIQMIRTIVYSIPVGNQKKTRLIVDDGK